LIAETQTDKNYSHLQNKRGNMGEKASQVSRVEKEAESAIIDADARIIDIASPQSDGDAANKKYVDNRVP
jgi:hypothetical protein